jgi:tetraacyldisaccharide 4'-kinase
MKILRLLLYPFAALYNLATQLRNHLYDIGHKPSFEFDTTVIAVGNLNVGGSGKTPMVEYLIQLLSKDFKVATLSRGYMRDTKGYRLATGADTARQIGDEPLQLFRKFGKEINVVVGEDRAFAIPNILHEFPNTDIILLDDALQHRPVRPRLSILVTDYAHPFYNDFILPLGRLREARTGAKRADIVVVTKCEAGISESEKRSITAEIRRYAGDKPIFFSTIRYGHAQALGDRLSVANKIILVSGIARAESLKQFCDSSYKVLKHFNFGDHHRYTIEDIKTIANFYRSQRGEVSIVTTEKDMVKLVEPAFIPYLQRLPWFYLPIHHAFIEDGLKFDKLVRAAATDMRRTE